MTDRLYTHVCMRHLTKDRSDPRIFRQWREHGELRWEEDEDRLLHELFVPEQAPLLVEDEKIHSVEPGHVGYRGEKLKRVRLNMPIKPRQFREFKESFAATWQSDIEYTTRYLVDRNIQMDTHRRVMNLDIETYMCLDSERAPKPVLTIAAHDNFTDELRVYGWWAHLETERTEESMVSPRTGREFKVIMHDNEHAFWLEYLEWFEIIRPDIITGWNVEGFDMAYIVSRLQRMHGNGYPDLSPMLSPYGEKPRAHRKRGSTFVKPTIRGLDILDLKQAYENLVGGRRSVNKDGIRELNSYSLANVSEYELKWGKLPPTKRLDEAWDSEDKTDLYELIIYNAVDVEAALAVDVKCGLTKFYVAQQCKFPYPFDAWCQNSRIIDAQLYRTFKGKYVLPSKPFYRKTPFSAAKVFLPPSGVYKNVGCLDLSAMYINIILSCNLSPDSIVDEDFSGPKCCVDGVYFRLDRQGIIPQAVANVLAERNKARSAAIKAREDGNESLYHDLWVEQGAWKTLQLSFYGVTGLPSFRLHDSRVSRGITWVGEHIIKWTWWYTEQDKYAVPIYGDTDSVYVKLPDEWDRDKCFDYLNNMATAMNTSYDYFMNDKLDIKFTPWTEQEEIVMDWQIGAGEHTMSMKFEKWFEYMIVEGVKKRYAGLKSWDEGVYKDPPVIDVTGYETVKSDTTPLFRQIQSQLFKLLLNGAEAPEVQEWVDEHKRQFWSLPAQNLAVAKKLSKDPEKYKVRAQHLKAMEYSQKQFGMSFSVGEQIYILKVAGKPEAAEYHEGVIAIDPDVGVPPGWEEYVDRETIWDSIIGRKLKSTLKRIAMDVKV